MSIEWSGLNSRSKHLYSLRHRAVTLSLALAYLECNSAIEPPEGDPAVSDPTREACPAGIFTGQIYWRGGRLMPEDSPI